MFYIEKIEEILQRLSVSETLIPLYRDIILFLLLCAGSVIIFYISKFFVNKVIREVIIKTKTEWDDKLYSNKFFTRLIYIIPAVIVLKLLPYVFPYYPGWILFLNALVKIYISFIVLLVFYSFLNSLNDVYQSLEVAKYKPIKAYLQFVKLFLAMLIIIIVISIIFNKSPVYLLTGIGALSAILLLIFKDTILGMVAGIQISANDMVRPGDWITMSKYNADGDIEEITLTTIKVRNFDRTLVYVPAYALISDSFINWRGMYEAEGRRIKRALYIDMNSIRFCTSEELDELKKIRLISEYIEKKQNEIDEFNTKLNIDTKNPVNGRRQTNIGIFRAYMENYLRSLNVINQDSIVMVRQLSLTDKGLPLEVYAFSVDKEWVNYENIQSDIFDHLIAALPGFGLKLYQSPTGGDVNAFLSHALSNNS